MSKIIDPDLINRDIEIEFTTSLRTIKLNISGSLTTDGVTGQCVYSKCKELWRTADDLIRFPFPIISITEKKFDMVNGWDWKDVPTKQLLRDAGWALKDTNNISQQEYMGFITLGTLGATDQVYYQQTGGLAPTDVVLTGPANQAVQIYATASYDYRNYFKCFVREYQKAYDQSQLSAIGETSITYQVYSFPLGNSADAKITHADSVVTGSQPYLSMSISYYTASIPVTIGPGTYQFTTVVSGNQGSKEQIYEFVQYQLRQNTDINSYSGSQTSSVTGKTADALLAFVGDTLQTKPGVYISGFTTTDINNIEFFDTGGVKHTYPFVAAGTLNFNTNLTSDISASYKMFFTSVPSGGFGSASAVIVNDKDDNPITGSVNGVASISFTFDYDYNTQGGRTSASDAGVTVVALGLSTGQYVSTAGTIGRSNANTFTLVAALERNYSNPV